MAQSATKSNNHNAVTSTRRSVRFSGKPKVDYYAEKVWSLVEDESKRRNVAVSAPASQNSNNAQSVQDNHAQQSVQRRRTHARQSNGQQQSSSEMMHKIVHQMDALREQIRVEERQRLFCGIFKQYLLDLGHRSSRELRYARRIALKIEQEAQTINKPRVSKKNWWKKGNNQKRKLDDRERIKKHDRMYNGYSGQRER
eukprot:212561_1